MYILENITKRLNINVVLIYNKGYLFFRIAGNHLIQTNVEIDSQLSNIFNNHILLISSIHSFHTGDFQI